MRILITALVVAVVASLARAQTMMPLPAFSSTFSSSGYTRGLFFQAPIDFTIVGLRVPDEAKNGKQNVAVYRMTAQPPTYPATTTGGLQFFKAGEPSANIIPCQIAFTKGEWVGVLGACGDGSMMYNSYGVTGTYPSQILGTPVNLDRFGTQTNIVTTQGTGAYWGIVNSIVSRVEVYVASTSLTGSGAGTPGSTIVFALKSPADGGLPYQMGSSFGNGPIPIDTRKLELSVDDLLVLSTSGLVPAVFQAYAGTLDAQGQAAAGLAIPNQPLLKGIRIYTAFVTLKNGAPSGIANLSPAFLFTVQ